jgi:hypothetical protein
LLSQKKKPRGRRRPDPLAGVWNSEIHAGGCTGHPGGGGEEICLRHPELALGVRSRWRRPSLARRLLLLPALAAGVSSIGATTLISPSSMVTSMVDKMRGPENSKIKLKIMRKGQDKPIEVSITRARIQLRSVRSRLEGDDVGFIRVTQFNERTAEDLKKAISYLSVQAGDKLKGFISTCATIRADCSIRRSRSPMRS